MRCMPRASRLRQHAAVAGAACLLLGSFGAPEVVAKPRSCVRVAVEEPFVLPDGSRHAAGSLRICLDREYSPVAGLHTITAGDRRAGVFLSRRARTEAPSSGPAHVAFARDARGTLSLIGYSYATGEPAEVYWIYPPRGRRPSADDALLALGPAPSKTLRLAAAEVP
jgi:hypothetical protein